MNDDRKRFEKLAEKIRKMKAFGEVVLSSNEDLALAVINLVSLEEHFFMTGEKTDKPGYFDFLSEVREMRKKFWGRSLPKEKHESETWCMSKHLLAATMHLMKVGTRAQGEGKKEKAKELSGQAYKPWPIFWDLRLNLLNVGDVK